MGSVPTSDGTITVEVPDGPGWQVETIVGAVQGATRTTFVKCKRGPPEFFFLMAKDYSVPATEVLPAEKLLREVYPRNYSKMFQQVKIDFMGPKTIGGREWWEAGFQFLHAKLGPIAKLERVTCSGEHVLIVSGEGAQNDVRARFAELTRWMDGARFALL